MDHFVETNGIKLHYVDYGGDGGTVILSHGLSANARFFEGLVRHGLTDHLHIISVDLRGRGLSDKPATGYTMEDHARDILGLMDALGLDTVMLGGHSFGGLLTMYISARYPERVKKMIVMDAGILHPSVRDLIKPSLERLGKAVPSLEAYLTAVKASPYYHDGFWDEDLETYYCADVEVLADGSVKARSRPDAIAEAVDGSLAVDWIQIMNDATQPALMIHAPDGVGPGDTPPIITAEGARQTVEALGDCTYVKATGNHVTMAFGKNAPLMVNAITEFVNS